MNSNGASLADQQQAVLAHRYIEHCICYFLNKEETKVLLKLRANIDPEITSKVWEQLASRYPQFFAAIEVKRQIANQILAYNYLHYSIHAGQRDEPIPAHQIVGINKSNAKTERKRTNDDLEADKENLNPNLPSSTLKKPSLTSAPSKPAQRRRLNIAETQRSISDAMLTIPILTSNNMNPPVFPHQAKASDPPLSEPNYPRDPRLNSYPTQSQTPTHSTDVHLVEAHPQSNSQQTTTPNTNTSGRPEYSGGDAPGLVPSALETRSLSQEPVATHPIPPHHIDLPADPRLAPRPDFSAPHQTIAKPGQQTNLHTCDEVLGSLKFTFSKPQQLRSNPPAVLRPHQPSTGQKPVRNLQSLMDVVLKKKDTQQ